MKLPGFLVILFILLTLGCTTPRSVHTSYKTIEEKYAHILEVDREDISNRKLYAFIDDWYRTPYKYGGKTKAGVDCSGFISVLYKEVFGKDVSGPSYSIYAQCEKIPKDKLTEGCLVFFKIDSKDISHIGIYLQNDKFAHASSKVGVVINDLNEDYYKKYFAGGGKLK